MHSSRIGVYCRVRPTDQIDREHIHFLPDHRTVQLQRPSRSPADGQGQTKRSKAKADVLSLPSPDAAATASSSPTSDTRNARHPQYFTVDGIFFDSVNDNSSAGGAFGGAVNGAFGQGANTQESVYVSAVRSMLTADGVLGGTSATVLCYGARGTGKSYTMFGDPKPGHHSGGGNHGSESAGIVQRAIFDLYRGIGELSATSASSPTPAALLGASGKRNAAAAMAEGGDEVEFTVEMTILQLQGDRVNDMLTRVDGMRAAAVSLDGKGKVVLKNVYHRPCPTAQDAFACLRDGLQVHRSSPHSCYCHLIVSFHIQQRSLNDSVAQTRSSVLHFADLAGAQSQRTTGDAAVSSEERHLASNVNRSLATLQQVVLALGAYNDFDDEEEAGDVLLAGPSSHMQGRGPAERYHGDGSKEVHVPYRQSKLTTLLKGAMGGRCLTTLLAHVRADRASLEATLHTLQFAKRAMCVEANPRANVSMDTASQVRHLQRQLTDLRTELRLQAQLAAFSAPTSTASPSPPSGTATAAPLAADEVQQVHDKVHCFVDGNTASLQVGSVREMQACFAFLRSLIEQKEVRVAELTNEVAAAEALASAAAASARQLQLENNSNNPFSSSARKSIDGLPVGSSNSSRCGSSRRHQSFNLASTKVPPLLSPGKSKDVYSPTVLDQSVGVGYGTSARASPHAMLSAQRLEQSANPFTSGGAPWPLSIPAAPRLATPPAAAAAAPPSPPPQSQPPQQHPTFADSNASSSTLALAATAPASLAAVAQSSAVLLAALPNAQRPQTAIQLPQTPQYRTDREVLTRPATSNGGLAASDPAKKAAFEVYKMTPLGAAQLQAIVADQAEITALERGSATLTERLAQAMGALQRRRQEEGLEASESDLARPLTAPSSSGRLSNVASTSQLGGDGATVVRPPTNGGSARQLGAHCHTLQEQARAMQSEHAHLLEQLAHRRAGLLANFEEWYTHRLWERGDARYTVMDATPCSPSPPPPPPPPEAAREKSARRLSVGRLPGLANGGGGSAKKRVGQVMSSSPVAATARPVSGATASKRSSAASPGDFH